jgi:hypothetical protein
MASVAARHPSCSRDRWRKLRRSAAAHLKPARPAVVNLASVPLHVAGLACIDFAAFHLAHGWGWLAAGASLIWLEHVIADQP